MRTGFRPRLEALEDRWLPSQVGLTVTSLADAGAGTLRAAIQAADAGSPSDRFTIGFTVNGTIDLQSPLPDLSNSIAIEGPGASSLTVERAAGASFASAIVTVDAGQTASLFGLTVANGNAGGIFNNGGTLTVANSAVVNNTLVAGVTDGAGIDNNGGTLAVRNSAVLNNSVVNNPNGSFAIGGGVFSIFGTLTISGSTVSGNSSQSVGGGVVNYAGTLTISRSTVSGNSAVDFAGGIFNNYAGALTVTASTVSGNSAQFGGGIYNNGGTVTVANGSSFCGNSATYGGAINAGGGSMTVRDAVFTGNSAAQGGGIYNSDNGGTLDVRGSSFTGNTASDSGGGIYNLGMATLQECTLSGNTAGAYGGGIFNGAFSTLTIDDSTVCNNFAALGADLYTLGVATINDSDVCVIGP